MDKEKLDKIIEHHKAQPVGYGYIDIIVLRDNYKDFISDLVNNGFTVKCLSWWEWCPDGNESEYGLGGPESNFYKGWFSELSIDVDDLKLSAEMDKNELAEEIINRIETKQISFPNEIITFRLNKWLTPAFWLDVPKNWRNKHCAY